MVERNMIFEKQMKDLVQMKTTVKEKLELTVVKVIKNRFYSEKLFRGKETSV